MQEPINDEDEIVNQLKHLQPIATRCSKIEVWYLAGYIAARRRAIKWHCVAIAAASVLSLLLLTQPAPKTVTHVVERVVYRDAPSPPDADPSSFAAIQQNQRLLQNALDDRWPVLSTGGSDKPAPVLGAWMTDPEQTIGG